MMNVQQDWAEIRKSPIDTLDIELGVRDFYLSIDFESEDFLAEIFEAKHILESARIMVFNLINPYENEYIKEYEAGYKLLSENSGRADRYLDELERDTLTKYEMSIGHNKEPKKHQQSYFIINYVRKLDVLMEHLVYYPLKNAFLKFQKPFYKDGEEVKKDEDLFCYFVFVELFKSSQILGNIMYEKKKTTGGTTSYETTYENQPDELPKNVKTKDETTDTDKLQQAEEFFKDEIGGENELKEEEGE